MAKTFYTEQDIDDLKRRGIDSLEVNDNVVLTELAVERAAKLGIRIRRREQSAPQAVFSPSVNAVYPREPRQTGPADRELHQRIKSEVLKRLDGQVDEVVLDAVITRLLAKIRPS